jgi:hypothetical protein
MEAGFYNYCIAHHSILVQRVFIRVVVLLMLLQEYKEDQSLIARHPRRLS